MIKKLTNIVQHYNQFLAEISENGFRSLTDKEYKYLEIINTEGLEYFWSDVYMKDIFMNVLTDLLKYPELIDYFDYSEEEKNITQNIFNLNTDKNTYEIFMALLLEKNNEAMADFLTIKSSGNVSLAYPNPTSQFLFINDEDDLTPASEGGVGFKDRVTNRTGIDGSVNEIYGNEIVVKVFYDNGPLSEPYYKSFDISELYILERNMEPEQKGEYELDKKITPIPYGEGVEFTPRDWDILKARGIMKDTEIDKADDWVITFPPGYWGEKYSKKMYSPKLVKLRYTNFGEFYGGGVVD